MSFCLSSYVIGDLHTNLYGSAVLGELVKVIYFPYMLRVNGCGTTLLGKKDISPADASYTSTRWFTLFWIPLVPLGTYKVIDEPKTFLSGTTYRLQKTQWDTKQIIFTYITGVIILAILIIVSNLIIK
jgi:hypothetical protein